MDALTSINPIYPLALVDISILFLKLALSISYISVPLDFKYIAISIFHYPLSVLLSIPKIALIHITVVKLQSAHTVLNLDKSAIYLLARHLPCVQRPIS